MLSRLRRALVGLAVIAASTVALPVATSSATVVAPLTLPAWSNTNIVAVSAGYNGTCAIQGASAAATSGTLFCWGKGAILGAASSTSSNVAVAVPATGSFTNTAVTAVAVGDEHACAIEGGKLWCWGGGTGGSFGVLGNGTSGFSLFGPTLVTANGRFDNDGAAGDAVTAIATSFAEACAIEGGEVFCWGNNNGNQLGLGASFQGATNVPNRVVDTATPEFHAATATEVSVGTNFSCATASTSVFCWGVDSYGNLGNSPTSAGVPVKVARGDFTTANTNVSGLDSGWDHSCARQSDTVRCWGRGTHNQLGTGSTSNASTPTNVGSGVDFVNSGFVTAVSAGERHTCAIEAGRLFCWGDNGSGRLGNGSTTAAVAPVLVSPSDVVGFMNTSQVTAVSAGQEHTCAIENKVVYCWGGNMHGQLGLGQLQGPSPTKPTKVFVVSAPSAPTISVTAQNAALSVFVTKPSDGGSTITSYEYQVDSGTIVSEAFNGLNSQSITISGLTNGTAYNVKVRAVNAIGAGAWSATSTSTPSAGGGGGGGGGTSASYGMISGTVNTPITPASPVVSGFNPAPTTYTVTFGALPTGLTLNASTGVISGTPTASSMAFVTISVSNGAQNANASVNFNISGPAACATGAYAWVGSSPTVVSGFGTAGFSEIGPFQGQLFEPAAVGRLSDGNIVMATPRFSGQNVVLELRKYLTTGVLDTNYGGGDGILEVTLAGNGSLSTGVRGFGPNGSIVVATRVTVAGVSNVHLVKIDNAGLPDTSFDTDGIASFGVASMESVQSVAVGADGAVLVGTMDSSANPSVNRIRKFTPAGAVDTAFASGSITQPSNNNSAGLSDGSVLVFSSATGQLQLTKYTPQGVVDTTWATQGVSTFGSTTASEGRGDIRVIGSHAYVSYSVTSQTPPNPTSVGLAKIDLATGLPDVTFGDQGGIRTQVLDQRYSPGQIVTLADGTFLVEVGITVSVNQGQSSARGRGYVRFSAAGAVDAAHASTPAYAKHGTCFVMPAGLVETSNGDAIIGGAKAIALGSGFASIDTGVFVKVNFPAFAAGSDLGGFTASQAPQNPPNNVFVPVTPPTTPDDEDDEEPRVPGRPNLVNDDNRPGLVRPPGQSGLVVDGETQEVVTTRVETPGANVQPNRRTPAQIEQIREAANNLVQNFQQQLPPDTPVPFEVVNTPTGAVIRNLVFDASGNPVDVPAEDIVLMQAQEMVLLVGANQANVTPDGRFQVPVGSSFGLAGSGFGEEEDGEFVVMSTPTLIAEFATAEDGTFEKSGTLPASIAVGDHTLVVATGSTYAVLGIQVVPTTLPVTGGDSNQVVVFALFTLVFGALLVRSRRTLLV